MGTQPPQPDWTLWRGRAQASLWQCLALSVDVDPRSLGVDEFLVLRASEGRTSLLADDDPDWLRRMCRRRSALSKALGVKGSGLRAGRSRSRDVEAELKLKAFAAWALKKRWKLPSELKELAGQAKPKTARKRGAKSRGSPPSASA